MTQLHNLLIFVHLVLTVMAGTMEDHLTSFVGVSFKECFQQCKQRLSCGSILYKHRSTYCTLYGQYLSNYRRSPGVIYREKNDWNGDQYTGACNSKESIPGETSEDTCDIRECPIPTEGHEEIQILGNLRQTGSKITYRCNNIFTGPVHSTCTGNGSWLPVTLPCDTHAYGYSGVNTYREPAYKLTNLNLFSIQTEYLNICLSRCNETAHCLGVNFSPETKTCKSTNRPIVLNMRPSTIDGWNNYYKILPISVHRKDGEKYKFTFEEGHSFCQSSMGTTMASLSDLELASSMGFTLCSCGWITDGLTYLSNWHHCGGFKSGVSKCWEMHLSDVFCKEKRFRSD